METEMEATRATEMEVTTAMGMEVTRVMEVDTTREHVYQTPSGYKTAKIIMEMSVNLKFCIINMNVIYRIYFSSY